MSDKRVYLVDDEEAIRRSASFMLRASGHQVEAFACGDDFLKVARDLEPGCVLLDIRMPGSDGLAVQQALVDRGIMLPVIIMTGHGDIGIAVRAMKAGAVDFIEKPFEKAALLGALEQGWLRLDRSVRQHVQAQDAAQRLKVLTAREREVLDGLVEGLPNKTIAFDLGISPRTVEIHRANLMVKLKVRSLSEALRLAFAAAEAEGIV
ncbi:two component transcriptional regulator, LuxR family [Sphingomonas laterariae]|uniref:Two component transcriptional regulator, LuxR family n=1 Tax=Edaphosphingomonas laterariae TaxID=861865 RepID=A0A239J3T8_9SPHN|nr:response regulator [Sphingomonas laterariae]SNT00571.1 two component transcriptional regulator, LuxR family [Sphingomonas laterariae]